MQRTHSVLPVTLFLLAGVAALAFLAVKAANLASEAPKDLYTVNARFENIGELKKNAAVRCAGVLVGHVSSIGLDTHRHQGLVRMQIAKDVHLPVDSSAQILTAGLLGDQFVGIEPGAGDSMLQDQSLLSKTRPAMIFESLIRQMVAERSQVAPAEQLSAVAR